MLKPKQLQMIEIMIANPTASQRELGEIVGVDKKTIQRWLKIDEFQNELKNRLKDIWNDSERIAINTMRNLAIDGDFKASKYILDSLGYAPAQKIEADVKTNINITIEE